MTEKRISGAIDRLTPEYINDFMKRRNTPIDLEPVSGDWIHCREARILISESAKVSLKEAQAALCLRAVHWVPLKVVSFSRHEEPHDYIDRVEYFREREPSLDHFQPKPLPKDWEELRQLFESIRRYEDTFISVGVHYANWALGDFKVTLEKDFCDVTIEMTGLHFDRPALLKTVGLVPLSPRGAAAKRSPIGDDEVKCWIATCGTENSKVAWNLIRDQFGNRAPKKTEQFERLWRDVKGRRSRGRPSAVKSPAR